MYIYKRVIEKKVNGRYTAAGTETDAAMVAQMFSNDMFSKIAGYSHVNRTTFDGYINSNGDHMVTVYYSNDYRAKYYFSK